MVAGCQWTRILSGARNLAFSLFIAFLLLGGAASGTAWAATYYVATNGSDSNPGTEAAPFKTILRGSRAMASGDTLLIRGGTYNEAMLFPRFNFVNGTPGAYTRYAAYPREEVIIKPDDTNGLLTTANTTAYVEISGLIFDGSNARGGGVFLTSNDDRSVHAHHVRLLNNEIRFTKRSAVQPTGGNEIIGNKIHGAYSYGMYAGGDNGIVVGNIFYDNGGYGLNLYNMYQDVNGWVIHNNIFYNNGRGFINTKGIFLEQAGVLLSRGSNQFYNNLVYNNPHGGVELWGRADNAFVANNTIYGNGGYGIFVNGAINDNNRIINNIVWGNGGSQIRDQGTNTMINNGADVAKRP